MGRRQWLKAASADGGSAQRRFVAVVAGRIVAGRAVKGFGALPDRALGLDVLAEELDAIALYALVHLTAAGPVIRFGHAQQVASLAAERIAAYHGTLRYHLYITDFIYEAKDLAEFVE